MHCIGAVQEKHTLIFWKHCSPFPNTSRLFPPALPSHLRVASRLRSQLLTSTYPTQYRLKTIAKSSCATCKLCLSEDESSIHFLATCPFLLPQRTALIRQVLTLNLPTSVSQAFTTADPFIFATNVLLPSSHLSAALSDILTTHCLRYILKIHHIRLEKLQV